jgi:hypothetical protein
MQAAWNCVWPLGCNTANPKRPMRWSTVFAGQRETVDSALQNAKSYYKGYDENDVNSIPYPFMQSLKSLTVHYKISTNAQIYHTHAYNSKQTAK